MLPPISANQVLMKEWDYEKNKELGFDPNVLTQGSGTKVWWKCKKGHEWQSAICDRTGKRGSKCPYCSNHIKKPVVCIETNIRYKSLSEAYRQTGINNICKACKDETRTAGGYHWRHEEDIKASIG